MTTSVKWLTLDLMKECLGTIHKPRGQKFLKFIDPLVIFISKPFLLMWGFLANPTPP